MTRKVTMSEETVRTYTFSDEEYDESKLLLAAGRFAKKQLEDKSQIWSLVGLSLCSDDCALYLTLFASVHKPWINIPEEQGILTPETMAILNADISALKNYD